MRTLLTLLFLVSFGALFAQVPPGGNMLNAETGTTYQQIGRCTVSTITVADQPFTKALRITTQSEMSNAWDAQVKFPAVNGIQENDLVLVAFYARTISSQEETGEGQLIVCIEENVTYAKELYYKISIGQDWKEYYAPVKCKSTLAASSISYLFHLGFDNQTIEVADVRYLNYQNSLSLEDLPVTEITYSGQAPDAAWRTPAEERINRIRKGQAEIVVLDEQGQVLKDANVRIEMVKHQFGFGTAIAANEFNDNEQYRNTIFEMFNEVVFENDLKWRQFNPGASNDHINKALDTLDAHHIPVRGHNVIWPSYRFTPSYLEALNDDPVAMRNAIDQRIDEVCSFTNGRLNDWDVINEPYSEHDIQDVLGDEVMADWFKRVRRNDRDVKLYLNDYSILSAGGKNQEHQDYYYDVVRYIDSLGGGIEGIGMQGHFGSELTSITRVYEILERYAGLNKDIKITEHDIDVTQRGVQADYTRDFMTIIFSHTSVKSLLMWGFWAGRHWKPESAFYEEDWTIRPHGEAWKDMIYKQWWTPEVSEVSGEQGEVLFDGFLGTYKYTVTMGDQERSGTFVMDQSHQSGSVNNIIISLDQSIPEIVEIIPSKPGFLCMGETVTLQAPVGEGLVYTWFLDETPLPDQTSAIEPGVAGAYTVQVSKGSVVMLSGPYLLEVREVPEVELSASGSLSFCEGESVTLSTNSNDAFEYDWMNGDIRILGNDTSLTVGKTGFYRLIVTSNGCSAEAGMQVDVSPMPHISIEALGDLSFCEGEELLLRTSPEPGLIYNWSKGDAVIEEDNFRISVTESGSYSVSSVIEGCVGSSDTLKVMVYPVPEATITVTGALSFCEGEFVTLSANDGEDLSYSWMKGSDMLELTDQSIDVEEEGSYTLVTSNLGCSSTSEPVLVTVLSITDPQCATGIRQDQMTSMIYPNPFKGTFHLKLNAPSLSGTRVELFDARGRLILNNELDPGSLLMEISVQEPGFYLLRIKRGELLQSFKLTAE